MGVKKGGGNLFINLYPLVAAYKQRSLQNLSELKLPILPRVWLIWNDDDDDNDE